MEKIATKNLKCPKHSNKDFLFVQINDVMSLPSSKKPLFYCCSCINNDLEFKTINYLMIDDIIQETDSKIIPKWPPVNDQQVIQDLIEFTSNKSQCEYVNQITNFFNQFKGEFLAKIDIIQKKMINQTLKYPTRQTIIETYQEISKIQQFKQFLDNNNKKSSIEENSTLCREFISQIESQKDQNTELFKNLINQAKQIEKDVNFNLPNIMKEYIFACMDNISFFKSDLSQDLINQNRERQLQSNTTNQNNNRDQTLSAELIMKLVSNKSNFCSDQFLQELNLILQRLNPLFQQYNFKKVHTENKEAIDFSKISGQKLNQIEDYVKHQTLLTTQQSYENKVKDSLEIKQINLIINSQMNFLNGQFTVQFEKFLIDVKPFLKHINFSNIFSDQNKFFLFRNLNINDEWIRNNYLQNLFSYNFQLLITQHNNGQLSCQVKKKQNGQQKIKKFEGNKWVNCVSEINLIKDLKYIFRIQIKDIQEGAHFMIGLMTNLNSNKFDGYKDYLSCHFRYINQFIEKSDPRTGSSNYGIDKILKGDCFKLTREKIIELRVCLQNQILEVVDYPNYQYKLGLDDSYKYLLTKNQDLKLYIGLKSEGIKIVLREAQIVNEFKN
ncbi:zinc carboxypeptidase family protein (macronuclear) [Tetrahymena thermophila SB210]|uniref:Zinc carboxypeptidase family protein n=1 Tax=Tetrahymena thermophila (strain SB210) TaxID=312017 RepID=Q22XP6_TETTS|nr:zinc carboxypeptidase family protein [Tetrahymena thermophila SB210]EAR90033.1 zinc carboxypeptidase family protein [Tetrahymena thermophila SB210]|eukprot:XP_001010278.1 zinc carboxypeptidase family protein [Tetrahymena thermophila SB210]